MISFTYSGSATNSLLLHLESWNSGAMANLVCCKTRLFAEIEMNSTTKTYVCFVSKI